MRRSQENAETAFAAIQKAYAEILREETRKPMILQCSHICKAFSTDTILNDISFHIEKQEKTAIVGINGSGKSTLLKIIVGELSADSGEIILAKGVTVGYLAQNQSYDSSKTILEEMQDAKPEIPKLEQQIAELTEKMHHVPQEELDKYIGQFDEANRRYEQLDGYAYQSELTGVLKGLGFSEEEFNKPVVSLSGGEKTRVALAKMLLQAPDLIILDEPTNHLDMDAVHWLENYLSSYRGAVLIVAHDRYFLDKIAEKVIELRRQNATVYTGNYTAYSAKRRQLLDTMMKQYLNQQAQIKHQEAVIDKLRQFNREKSIKRAESREKQLEKTERLEKPVEENTEMRLFFSPAYQSGKDVLSAQGLSKRFGDNLLFENLDFSLKRGEHVAIIGSNGSGKTTLLKIINELEPADSGTFTLGSNVKIGYYDQEHHVLHMEKTVFDEIRNAYPDMTNTQIRNVLAAFLFTEDDVFKQIKNLSGGERGRVSLAMLMLSDANFLILDEPTNHLDIDSKAILEDALNQFEGTVLYVSHDRYFINTTAHRILDLAGHTLTNYLGNYDYYLEKKDALSPQKTPLPDSTKSDGEAAVTDTKRSWQQQKEQQARKRKLENEIKKTEEEIAALESDNESVDQQLANPVNATNSVKLQELAGRREENDSRLLELMEHWEQLMSEKESESGK